MTNNTNNPPFQLTIPADVLVNKVNDYVMVMWVLCEKEDGAFIDLLTEQERDNFIQASNWTDDEDCPTRLERIELTLNQLMAEA